MGQSRVLLCKSPGCYLPVGICLLVGVVVSAEGVSQGNQCPGLVADINAVIREELIHLQLQDSKLPFLYGKRIDGIFLSIILIYGY